VVPEADTEKLAVFPLHTVTADGCVEMVVDGFTVSEAFDEFTLPHPPVTTTLYEAASDDEMLLSVKVGSVAPLILMPDFLH